MKSVLLIGLSKFGQTLGQKLLNMGDEVMIIDKNEDKINMLANKYTNALIMNAANEEALKSIDVGSFDACVVAIGDDFQSSLEITSTLKDLGAKHVISKATTLIQKKFLLRNGADEVIYPDIDIAEKVAIKINIEKVYDYVELNSECSIMEVAVPNKWIGKKIIELNARKIYGINILAITKENKARIYPDASYVFEKNENILVFGKSEDIIAFTNKIN